MSENPEKKVRGPNRKPIYDAVVADMKALGVYSDAYEDVINDYVDTRVYIKRLQAEWVAAGSPMVEEYTNKAGATNMRKVAILAAIDAAKRDALAYLDRLQLNPKAQGRITKDVKPESVPKEQQPKSENVLDTFMKRRGRG